MKVDLLPLLHIQRDLYAMPRDMNRFHEYLKTLKGTSADDVELAPLVMMNPMGKAHCLEAVEHLIAIGAEAAAEDALVEARPRVADAPGAFKVSLVLADDRMGGWTNRAFAGYSTRFPQREALHKRPFISVPCWTSEAWSVEDARRQTLAQVYRVAHTMRRGDPKTLRAMMAQEAEALALAGLGSVTLPDDDLAYAREVIAPHLDAADQPTVFACLFGDEAASEAGYPQLGLPRNAGLQVALGDRIDRMGGRQNEQNGQDRNGQNLQDHEDG